MERLTTEHPETNTEVLLNYAYAKDGRVTLRYANGEDAVDLAEYIEKMRRELDFDCGVCAADVMDGACMECDCVLAVLNSVAIQAAELRARLAAYEDTGLEPEEIVDRLAKAKVTDILCAEAEKIFPLPPCEVGDTVWYLRKWCNCDSGTPCAECKDKIMEIKSSVILSFISYGKGEVWLHLFEADVRGSDLGKTVFLTREEAERALEGGNGDAR